MEQSQAWTSFLAAVLDSPLERRVGPRGFSWIFEPFVEEVRREIEGGTGPDGVVVSEAFAEALGRRLHQNSARTLALEVNRARVAGVLDGPTPESRFERFVHDTGTSDGLAALFAAYPVLARLVGQDCVNTVASARELLCRLAADRPALGAARPVAEVVVGAGDVHRGGRSVVFVTFEDGWKVVYQPRPLRVHARFTEIVAWFNTRLDGVELRTAELVVRRRRYGWIEFIEHKPCGDPDEIDEFYQRLGALLALLYAIDATDVHFENIIACGGHPVLVDTETVFHPTLSDEHAADPAVAALTRSVQRTMILPWLNVGDRGAFDISGLTGGRDADATVEEVAWVDEGTDRMCMTRVPAEVGSSQNLPVLNGCRVNPVEHAAALLAGFLLGYRAIADHRTELAVTLRQSAEDEVRVLVRPTAFYSRLLDEATHPDLLTEEAAVRRHLSGVLREGSAGDPLCLLLVDGEVADLSQGDVPVLTGRPGSRDVWNSAGTRFAGALPESALTSVRGKLEGMGELDLARQKWLIEAALAASSAEPGHHVHDTVEVRQESTRRLDVACEIANHVVDLALPAGGRVNWLGLELVEDRYWTVQPMGAGLGEGYLGVALFLAEVARHSGGSRYHELACASVAAVPGLLAKLEADPELAEAAGCGGPLGLGGVAYALARLGVLLDRPDVHDFAARVVAIMPEPRPDTPVAFTTGLAGAVVAMRSVHELTGVPAAERLAALYADALSRRPREAADGFATGKAGVEWALGVRANDVGTVPLGYGWCAGAAGYLMTRPESPHRLPEDPLVEMSLCHGESGLVDVLCEIDPPSALRRAGRLTAAIEHYGPRCGTPKAVPSAGLLTGLAGIGYALLRPGADVPSALLLRAS